MRAEVRGKFQRAGRDTKLVDVFETGGLRLRLPNARDGCEAVVLNTAGGLAGGDEARLTFVVGRGASVRLTTQSAEKIYRADGAATVVKTDIDVGDGASVVWMPQETILFDGSHLNRALAVEMARGATFIAAEMTVFGRVARGEKLGCNSFHDRWRIRHGGTLLFAEDTRLDGGISEILQKAAIGDGACAIATLICVASNSEECLQSVRAILNETAIDGGASAWNGMLVARLASRTPFHLRKTVGDILQCLSRAPMPTVWSI